MVGVSRFPAALPVKLFESSFVLALLSELLLVILRPSLFLLDRPLTPPLDAPIVLFLLLLLPLNGGGAIIDEFCDIDCSIPPPIVPIEFLPRTTIVSNSSICLICRFSLPERCSDIGGKP